MNAWRVITGDCREVLAGLDAGSAHTCVTSPPYFGLRDYGHDGQIGLEPSPDEFVAALVAVFRDVRRVLRDDGTVWLNLGDSYNAYNGGAGPGSTLSKTQTEQRPRLATGYGLQVKSLKPKDLLGIPWLVAFALRADGWFLRSEIIWHKPNPMPESVTDRPTKAHEQVFLLSKQPRYYYDADAIREDAECDRLRGPALHGDAVSTNGNAGLARRESHGVRNKRTVWTIATQPYSGAHFATFPPKLIEPCVLAGCPEGGTVLDPFNGAGTAGLVALRHNRSYIGIELNPEYADLARQRIRDDAPLLTTTGEAA